MATIRVTKTGTYCGRVLVEGREYDDLSSILSDRLLEDDVAVLVQDKEGVSAVPPSEAPSPPKRGRPKKAKRN